MKKKSKVATDADADADASEHIIAGRERRSGRAVFLVKGQYF